MLLLLSSLLLSAFAFADEVKIIAPETTTINEQVFPAVQYGHSIASVVDLSKMKDECDSIMAEYRRVIPGSWEYIDPRQRKYNLAFFRFSQKQDTNGVLVWKQVRPDNSKDGLFLSEWVRNKREERFEETLFGRLSFGCVKGMFWKELAKSEVFVIKSTYQDYNRFNENKKRLRGDDKLRFGEAHFYARSDIASAFAPVGEHHEGGYRAVELNGRVQPFTMNNVPSANDIMEEVDSDERYVLDGNVSAGARRNYVLKEGTGIVLKGLIKGAGTATKIADIVAYTAGTGVWQALKLCWRGICKVAKAAKKGAIIAGRTIQHPQWLMKESWYLILAPGGLVLIVAAAVVSPLTGLNARLNAHMNGEVPEAINYILADQKDRIWKFRESQQPSAELFNQVYGDLLGNH